MCYNSTLFILDKPHRGIKTEKVGRESEWEFSNVVAVVRLRSTIFNEGLAASPYFSTSVGIDIAHGVSSSEDFGYGMLGAITAH